jgi:hypothetical protein
MYFVMFLTEVLFLLRGETFALVRPTSFKPNESFCEYSFRVKMQSCLEMLNLQKLSPRKKKTGVKYGSSPLKSESKCGDF